MIPVILVMAGIFCSCTNDLNTIKRITFDPKAPDDVTKNMEVFYSDSGYAKVRIFAAIAENYSKPQHIMKLKDKLKVDFFDDRGKITSSLTAKYGEINYATGIMFVQDSVRLWNYADKREMRTNKLFWNQRDSTIYSNEQVTVKSPKGTGTGTSITTKQDFSYYKLTNPQGKYEFE